MPLPAIAVSFAGLSVLAWQFSVAISISLVLYLLSKMVLPPVFDSLEFSWPSEIINFMHYFRADVCVSMILGTISAKISKTIIMQFIRAVTK